MAKAWNGDTKNGDTKNGDTENGDTKNGDTKNGEYLSSKLKRCIKGLSIVLDVL